jgi:epoxyqueuosine reductase
LRKEVAAEIRRFALESPTNRMEDGTSYFDEPLIGFASGDDPIFTEYKRVIGDFHLTPFEIMAKGFDVESPTASVIVWILPITQATRESNRRQDLWPSLAWAHTRTHGESFNVALRRHLVAWLEAHHHRAIAPQLAPFWKEFPDSPVGIASAWSERHAAYAAGLGTFSLNDALITPRGIAHRIGSVVTDLPLTPDPRPYPDHLHNCLFHREGTCGLCIGRCPVGALSKQGHDKPRCRQYVYEEAPRKLAELYNAAQTGCGLCQTRVPCEGRIPKA